MTELLQSPFLGQATWLWLVFVGVVVALLAFDLGVLHRHDSEIGVRESLWLSGGYIGAATLFGGWLWWQLGAQSGIDYFTGFMIEKSLSMDNVFVIAMIFSYFAIPRQYQHRVLFWGILGVIVLRAVMIGLDAALVTKFDWVLYLFGAFLVATGIKMLWMSASHAPGPGQQPRAALAAAPPARDAHAARQRVFCACAAPECRREEGDGAVGHAAVPGAVHGGVCRPDLCRGLGASHLCHHHRPVHRLHQQHLCHPGAACAVLCAGGHGAPLCLFK